MDNSNQPRDIVFCHQCENEWYRDEHGLTCPTCESDFTEIVEAANDPREDEAHIPADTQTPGGHGEFYAPDPGEQDIDDLRLEQTGPGRYRLRGTYRTEYTQRQGQEQGQAGGLMGIVGSVLQNMLGGGQQPQQPQQQQLQQPQPRQGIPLPGQQGPRLGIEGSDGPPRPASAPGFPPNNGAYIRHGHGPGFSYTIASSGTSNFTSNLSPRNANAPQPFQPQPDHIEQMLAQMMANIGAPAGQGGMRGQPRMNPFFGGDPHGAGGGFVGGPFMMGGPGGQLRGFGDLFQMFGPPGGVAGDAVFTQEALDRVITQLMEQHQTGNAPGPATEAAIKALPTKTISETDLGDNGKAECSICMDEVDIGGTVTVLPCHHWFHAECIDAWLGEHDTCPHCRKGIMPKEGEGTNSSRPRDPTQAPMHDMRSAEYARSNVPGAFPLPRQNSAGSTSGFGGGGDGSQQNPYTVPESPTLNRRNSTGGDRRRSTGGGGGGMFSRMRDAFGGGSSGSRG